MTAVARPGLQPLKIQQNNKDNTSKAGSTPTTLKASEVKVWQMHKGRPAE